MSFALDLFATGASMSLRAGDMHYIPDGPSSIELALIGAAIIGVQLAIRRAPRDDAQTPTVKFHKPRRGRSEAKRPTRGAA